LFSFLWNCIELPRISEHYDNFHALTNKVVLALFQLTPDVESALLQQVLQLTPEQLSSLPVEQQQQVIQLQKMLSAGK
jgi:hypothetical protein